MEITGIYLYLTVTLIYVLYLYGTRTYDFWKKRGIPGPKPKCFIGTLGSVIQKKQSLGDYLKEIYDSYKNEKMIGIFATTEPILVLKDPDLIKCVLVKDFTVFPNRAIINVNEKIEPLSQNLFALDSLKWRPLRSKLSSVFTSGKLKKMFYLLLECSQNLRNYLDNNVEKKGDSPIEICTLASKFTMDVVGRCVFGIQMNTLNDEENEFCTIGNEIVHPGFKRSLRLWLRATFPTFYSAIFGKLFPESRHTNFFVNSIKNTMEMRQTSGIIRHDFVDLLMGLRDDPSKINEIEMTDIFIAAQAFIFFAAGFETSASTMTNALYELAQNQWIQTQLRNEILSHLEQNNGELTYDLIKDMKYLEKVFLETSRKYPVGTLLFRRSVSKYHFEGTKITIPSQQKIWIPIYAIHHDPDFYPNPKQFDPERFDEENIKRRHPMTFLPFGNGPRNCIGARFASYQTKVGLIEILRNYNVDICEETEIPYKHSCKNMFLLTPKNGIYLKLRKLKTD